MKLVLWLSLIALSVNGFAEVEIYNGNSDGAKCELHLDLEGNYVALGQVQLHNAKFEFKGRNLVAVIESNYEDYKFEIIRDRYDIPVEATLSSKLFVPWYSKDLVCKDLIRVR